MPNPPPSPGNSRSGNLLRQLPMKPIQLLQRLQARDGTTVLNPVTEKRRQDLNLQPGQEPRRKSLDHRREIRHGFPTQNRVFVVDILAQRLHDINQACFFRFDIYLFVLASSSSSSINLAESTPKVPPATCSAICLASSLLWSTTSRNVCKADILCNCPRPLQSVSPIQLTASLQCVFFFFCPSDVFFLIDRYHVVSASRGAASWQVTAKTLLSAITA